METQNNTNEIKENIHDKVYDVKTNSYLKCNNKNCFHSARRSCGIVLGKGKKKTEIYFCEHCFAEALEVLSR